MRYGLLFLLGLAAAAAAGPPDTLWTRRWGGPGREWGYRLVSTRRQDRSGDLNWLVCGAVEVEPYMQGLVIEFDSLGRENWHQTFVSGHSCVLRDCRPAGDDGWIFAGSSGYGDREAMLLLRTDRAGNQVWKRTFSDPGPTYPYMHANAVCALGEGWLVVGPAGAHGTNDGLFIRTDAQGGELGRGRLGGPSDNDLLGAAVTPEGGALVAGWRLPPEGERRAVSYRLDAEARLVETRTDSVGEYHYIEPLPEGGWLAAGAGGQYGRMRPTVGILDGAARVVWWSPIWAARGGAFRSACLLDDGGIVAVGTVTYDTPGEFALVLARYTMTGDTLWTMSLPGWYGHSVRAWPGGGFLVAGSCSSDLLLACFGPDPGALAERPVRRLPAGLPVSPNPARGPVRVGTGSGFEVFDAGGRRVCRVRGEVWDLSDDRGRPVRSGVYVVRSEGRSAALVIPGKN